MSNQIEAIALNLLEKAKSAGASAAEVSVANTEGFSVNVRKGEVDTVEFNRDKGLTLTLYHGQRQGVVSTSDLSPHALEQCLQKAWYIAQHTDEDPASGLAPADRMAQHAIELDLYHPWAITPEEVIPQLKDAEALAMSSDPRISNSEGVSFDTHQSFSVYANSHGFCGHRQSTSHSFSCVLLASDEKGNMQRDYDYTRSREATALEDFSTVAKRAAMYTTNRLGARIISTAKLPVIFHNRIATQLWSELLAAISGGNLYRDASFLKNKAGQAILNPCVTIIEDPHVLRGFGSCYFDGEGVATSKRHLVQQGILQGYLLSSYSARRLGLATTGNAGGAHNILVQSTGEDETALFRKMGKGLLINDLMGMGINLVTGDFSQGASGYWIENGEIQFPVEGITIAGNLSDMFMNITAIGNDVNQRSAIQSGSILISEMMVAGKD